MTILNCAINNRVHMHTSGTTLQEQSGSSDLLLQRHRQVFEPDSDLWMILTINVLAYIQGALVQRPSLHMFALEGQQKAPYECSRCSCYVENTGRSACKRALWVVDFFETSLPRTKTKVGLELRNTFRNIRSFWRLRFWWYRA